mgnify:FL=1
MKLKEGFIIRELAGRYVVLPVGGDPDGFQGMIQMNKTGAFLWESLSTERTKAELVQLVLENYDVDQEAAEADVDVFVKNLSEKGIIEE